VPRAGHQWQPWTELGDRANKVPEQGSPTSNKRHCRYTVIGVQRRTRSAIRTQHTQQQPHKHTGKVSSTDHPTCSEINAANQGNKTAPRYRYANCTTKVRGRVGGHHVNMLIYACDARKPDTPSTKISVDSQKVIE